MPWLRTGDQAATYPKVMMTASLQGSDDRTVNEVFGWLTRCTAQSAGHETDYLIDAGTAEMLGGRRTAELVRICKRVGLLTVVKTDGLVAYQVIDDPEFLHVRLKAEVDWERQRKRDNATPALLAPVRLRDGDGCRYCGVVTYWGGHDRRGGRVGTFDHLLPGQPGTVATMVVACRTCNSRRKTDGDLLELKPVPPEPVYSTATAEYLRKHLDVVVPVLFQRPGGQPGITHSAARHPARVRPEGPGIQSGDSSLTCGPMTVLGVRDQGTGTTTAEEEAICRLSADNPPSSAENQGSVSGNPGTGRVGSGRVEQGAPGRDGSRRSRRRVEQSGGG